MARHRQLRLTQQRAQRRRPAGALGGGQHGALLVARAATAAARDASTQFAMPLRAQSLVPACSRRHVVDTPDTNAKCIVYIAPRSCLFLKRCRGSKQHTRVQRSTRRAARALHTRPTRARVHAPLIPIRPIARSNARTRTSVGRTRDTHTGTPTSIPRSRAPATCKRAPPSAIARRSELFASSLAQLLLSAGARAGASGARRAGTPRLLPALHSTVAARPR